MRAIILWQGGLFAALVLAIAALAGVRMTPVPLPAARADSGQWLDGRVARSFETHYDAVFPGRSFGTSLWAAIEYVLFAEGKPGVIVGRNGWLYTDEEFRTYPDAEGTLGAHLSLIQWVDAELASQGTRLVVALVPSKARLYPEFLGRREPASIHQDLYYRAQEAILGAGIGAPDLASALADCKRMNPVFLRTDTHWSPEGARCAAEALTRGARRPGEARYATRVERVERSHGDLTKFLPLAPYFSGLMPPQDSLAVRITEPVGVTVDADALLGEAPDPEVVLVGTSYSADPRWDLAGALREGLQEDVANLALPGQGPFAPLLQYLQDRAPHPDSVPPRLLIWEIPERYLIQPRDLKVAAGSAVCPPETAAPAPAGAVRPVQLLQNHRSV